MLLHKDKSAFKDLVEITAMDVGLQPFQIEKDYYVSLILKELSKIDELPIVFKGGTSLSKCYDAINRFSEDIDLAVIFDGEKLPNAKRRKLKQKILNVLENLNLNLLNEQSIRSRRDFNKYKVKYDNLYEADNTMVEDILIETIVSYNPYPTEILNVTNYITKYLMENDHEDIIEQYELNTFKMNVQTINRTFVDKVYAVCDYHLQQDYYRHSRHIYDLHKIFHNKYFNIDIVSSIIDDVTKDRQKYGIKNFSSKANAKPNDILKEIVVKNVYEYDYNEITLSFIHEDVSYETALKTIEKIIDQEIMPETVKDYK